MPKLKVFMSRSEEASKVRSAAPPERELPGEEVG
jgi:hypothetical protein